VNIQLIGNYLGDRQQSMQRFADFLARGLGERGHHVRLTRPEPVFGRLCPGANGIGKWLGYIDKFLLFPRRLRRLAQTSPAQTIFHVCDHSNAMYGRCLGGGPSLLTCHDLLAVRGALGESATMCRSSPAGRVLQKCILARIGDFPLVACASSFTRSDLRRLVPGRPENWSVVIHNALNDHFHPMEPAAAAAIISQRFPLLANSRFLLHVGSSHPRKNRAFLARAIAAGSSPWQGNVVFAGESASSEERAAFAEAGVAERLWEFTDPGHEEIKALYSIAHALVFPSWSEGFGWPVIEAMACGCPVVASTLTSVPEVAGGAALLVDPGNPLEGAMALQKLENPFTREELQRLGFENLLRFDRNRILESNENLYRQLLQGGSK
jgi:glycosyltransferase involved in cell wall biosynthesis